MTRYAGVEYGEIFICAIQVSRDGNHVDSNWRGVPDQVNGDYYRTEEKLVHPNAVVLDEGLEELREAINGGFVEQALSETDRPHQLLVGIVVPEEEVDFEKVSNSPLWQKKYFPLYDDHFSEYEPKAYFFTEGTPYFRKYRGR